VERGVTVEPLATPTALAWCDIGGFGGGAALGHRGHVGPSVLVRALVEASAAYICNRTLAKQFHYRLAAFNRPNAKYADVARTLRVDARTEKTTQET
jgi:hypothetical protein